jgi:hypothetical protein
VESWKRVRNGEQGVVYSQLSDISTSHPFQHQDPPHHRPSLDSRWSKIRSALARSIQPKFESLSPLQDLKAVEKSITSIRVTNNMNHQLHLSIATWTSSADNLPGSLDSQTQSECSLSCLWSQWRHFWCETLKFRAAEPLSFSNWPSTYSERCQERARSGGEWDYREVCLGTSGFHTVGSGTGSKPAGSPIGSFCL